MIYVYIRIKELFDRFAKVLMEFKLAPPVKLSANKKRERSTSSENRNVLMAATGQHKANRRENSSSIWNAYMLIRFSNTMCVCVCERMSSLNRIVNTLALSRVAIDTICDTRIDLWKDNETKRNGRKKMRNRDRKKSNETFYPIHM